MSADELPVRRFEARGEPGAREDAWLAALERRHFADLTFPEVARALRALSSCYVERRSRLGEGGALATRGKRAAFAMLFGPLHFHVTRHVLRGLDARDRINRIVDLGCGTGVAGAAWAIESGASRIAGWDRNAWAVREANWTYRSLQLRGRALQGNALRVPVRADKGSGIVLAYLINELQDDTRAQLRAPLQAAASRGARVLVIEPIARRMAPWWSEWQNAFLEAGGRADEWRFPSDLPQRQRDLAKAAGLDPRELTARTLWI